MKIGLEEQTLFDRQQTDRGRRVRSRTERDQLDTGAGPSERRALIHRRHGYGASRLGMPVRRHLGAVEGGLEEFRDAGRGEDLGTRGSECAGAAGVIVVRVGSARRALTGDRELLGEEVDEPLGQALMPRPGTRSAGGIWCSSTHPAGASPTTRPSSVSTTSGETRYGRSGPRRRRATGARGACRSGPARRCPGHHAVAARR